MINMFNYNWFKDGLSQKGEQKLFIRFVTAFCYCCLRDSRVSLLRQAFIFSEEISCVVINFGMEICVCGLLFHVRTFTQKKPRGIVRFLNLDALWQQVSPKIVFKILQRVVLFSGGKKSYFLASFTCNFLGGFFV